MGGGLAEGKGRRGGKKTGETLGDRAALNKATPL